MVSNIGLRESQSYIMTKNEINIFGNYSYTLVFVDKEMED